MQGGTNIELAMAGVFRKPHVESFLRPHVESHTYKSHVGDNSVRAGKVLGDI